MIAVMYPMFIVSALYHFNCLAAFIKSYIILSYLKTNLPNIADQYPVTVLDKKSDMFLPAKHSVWILSKDIGFNHKPSVINNQRQSVCQPQTCCYVAAYSSSG